MVFGKTWSTSERKYDIVAERDVKIPISDGVMLDCDVFLPDSDEKFPAILGLSPYRKAPQTAPIMPTASSAPLFRLPGQEKGSGYLEAGDPNFFVRRGYVQIVANVRGTGKSGGIYPFVGPPEAQDGVEVIDWIAKQPWCNGNVGMFGVSYFSWIQFYIAALNPPNLKCLFAPWGATDIYRDTFYRGGILAWSFWRAWASGSIWRGRMESWCRKHWGEAKFKEAIVKAIEDEDIAEIPDLVKILQNPDEGNNALVVDAVLNPLDGPYWDERRVEYAPIKVPAYIGACPGMMGLHWPAAFRSWEKLNVPKKMILGTPAYLDRPLYQLQWESLRWFDYWLKGIKTQIMDEPPIRIFVTGTSQWKEAEEWPLPETKWTPFYLHEKGLLCEHELWPNEGSDSYDDSPWYRGYLEYFSPVLVEDTEVIGPIVANFYASVNDTDILWLVSLWDVDEDGKEMAQSRGWLRGSHREIDPMRSKPWRPYHPHTKAELLERDRIYEFNIEMVPTAHLFKAGSRIKLKITGVDDTPKHTFDAIAGGHIARQSPSRVTIYHNPEHPSHILLPVTRGNILGTFISGGKPYV
jgi:uncharacterized protein